MEDQRTRLQGMKQVLELEKNAAEGSRLGNVISTRQDEMIRMVPREEMVMAVPKQKERVVVRKVVIAGRKKDGKKRPGLQVSRIDDMFKSVVTRIFVPTVGNVANKRKSFMEDQEELTNNKGCAAKRAKGM